MGHWCPLGIAGLSSIADFDFDLVGATGCSDCAKFLRFVGQSNHPESQCAPVFVYILKGHRGRTGGLSKRGARC